MLDIAKRPRSFIIISLSYFLETEHATPAPFDTIPLSYCEGELIVGSIVTTASDCERAPAVAMARFLLVPASNARTSVKRPHGNITTIKRNQRDTQHWPQRKSARARERTVDATPAEASG